MPASQPNEKANERANERANEAKGRPGTVSITGPPMPFAGNKTLSSVRLDPLVWRQTSRSGATLGPRPSQRRDIHAGLNRTKVAQAYTVCSVASCATAAASANTLHRERLRRRRRQLRARRPKLALAVVDCCWRRRRRSFGLSARCLHGNRMGERANERKERNGKERNGMRNEELDGRLPPPPLSSRPLELRSAGAGQRESLAKIINHLSVCIADDDEQECARRLTQRA